MAPNIKRSRFRIWVGAAIAIMILVVIGALIPENQSAIDARNAAAWEQNLREANGPNWEPTKAEEAMLRSSAMVTAQRMGPPPTPDR